MRNNLWRLTLDTNPEDCNLHCIMCEEHSPYSNYKQKLFEKTGIKRRLMPSQWIEKIFQEAQKLHIQEIIPSTMGEPLLYKDIDLFFEFAKKYNIRINLTTNGTFEKRSVEEWAKIIIPVTSDTKISINGATKKTAESIMLGINFEKQIENIQKFVFFRNHYYKQNGYYSRISFQLTFMQNNMQQLPEIIKLAAKLDIDRIKGHHLWTHFREIEHLSIKSSPEAMQKWNKIVDLAYQTADKYRKPNGEKIKLEQIYYLKPSQAKEVPQEYDCPFLGRELWISATGKISPCCAPDEQRKNLGDFGYYPQTSIFDVLKSENYTNLIKNYKSHPLCKVCVMRKKTENDKS